MQKNSSDSFVVNKFELVKLLLASSRFFESSEAEETWKVLNSVQGGPFASSSEKKKFDI